MALQEQDIDQLEELLFSDTLAEDTLDYFGLHGLISATVVGPEPIDNETLSDLVFADQKASISQEQLNHFVYCVNAVSAELQENLNEGIDISLPYENEDEFEACLESWCIGFMEGFFHNEKAWFGDDEEVTAELLLPIMALSGLFDSEEFDAIEKNEKLMTQFASIIGDQLTDIYLFYHAK